MTLENGNFFQIRKSTCPTIKQSTCYLHNSNANIYSQKSYTRIFLATLFIEKKTEKSPNSKQWQNKREKLERRNEKGLLPRSLHNAAYKFKLGRSNPSHGSWGDGNSCWVGRKGKATVKASETSDTSVWTLCLDLLMRVCVDFYGCVQVCVHRCMKVSNQHWVSSSGKPSNLSPWPVSLDWLEGKPQGSSCLYLLEPLRLQEAAPHLAFSYGFWRWASGPHVCEIQLGFTN